jgi:hypothetical protein
VCQWNTNDGLATRIDYAIRNRYQLWLVVVWLAVVSHGLCLSYPLLCRGY